MKSVTQKQWVDMLQQWSRDILQASEYSTSLPQEAVDADSGWIGYQPASEEQIKSTESRLGIALPRSYKNFVRATNGWPVAGPFVDVLLALEDSDWFSQKSRDWLNSWRHGYSYFGQPGPVRDEDYFIYGKDQNPLLIRDEYLDRVLQISDGGNAVYLLNPEVTFVNDEWEAWVFESETGAKRYQSFWDLMIAEYESFLQLKDI